jgi:hypothetical protein
MGTHLRRRSASFHVINPIITWRPKGNCGHERICSKSYAKQILALNQRCTEASINRSFRRRTPWCIKISRHGGRGTGFEADSLAVEHHQVMVHALPEPIIAKASEPTIGRLMQRKMLRQQSPRTATPKNVQNRIQHFSHWPTPRSAGLGRRRQQGRDNAPLSVAHSANGHGHAAHESRASTSNGSSLNHVGKG